MRADRLISLLLLLNARGRMTARQLADELEVSERTIYRDLDVLSAAGVPVYSQPGNAGGISIDEHYRLTLTGLSPTQVQALFAPSAVGPLRDLGLAEANQVTLLKLLAALPERQRTAAEHIQQRVYIDPANWFQVIEGQSILPDLQRAVWEDRRLRFDYHSVEHDWQTQIVDAYGLVAKANIWYLVGRRSDGEYRTYRAGRLRTVQVLAAIFVRECDFDLGAYWRAAAARFEQASQAQFPPYTATVRVHRNVDWYFPGYLEGRYRRLSEPDPSGWALLEVTFASLGDAKSRLLGLGAEVEVVSPPELAHAIVAEAHQIVARLDQAR
jgi:predicted DNA-binding transcriptional regulator YafY